MSGFFNPQSAIDHPQSCWVGWCWDRATGAWLSVCTAPDPASCHRELIRWAQVEGVPMRVTCLTGGGRPTWTPKE